MRGSMHRLGACYPAPATSSHGIGLSWPAALNPLDLVKARRDGATIERLRAVAGDAGCHACHTPHELHRALARWASLSTRRSRPEESSLLVRFLKGS